MLKRCCCACDDGDGIDAAVRLYCKVTITIVTVYDDCCLRNLLGYFDYFWCFGLVFVDVLMSGMMFKLKKSLSSDYCCAHFEAKGHYSDLMGRLFTRFVRIK